MKKKEKIPFLVTGVLERIGKVSYRSSAYSREQARVQAELHFEKEFCLKRVFWVEYTITDLRKSTKSP